MPLEGIDLSRWNAEPVNYKGVTFAFIQITHGLNVEPLAAEHVASARKAKVTPLAYHFLEAGDGAKQAAFCAIEAKRLGLHTVPLALDAETVGLAPLVRPFIKEAKKHFPSVGLYSYLSWISSNGGGLMTADWGWVAYPGAFTLPQGWPDAKTLFWQYGTVAGIDRDKWRFGQAAFDRFLNPPAPAPVPPPVVPPKPPGRRSLRWRIRHLLRRLHRTPRRRLTLRNRLRRRIHRLRLRLSGRG